VGVPRLEYHSASGFANYPAIVAPATTFRSGTAWHVRRSRAAI
jgi:hypothetical protein